MVASFVVDWIASLQVKSVGFALEFFWRREGTGLIIRRIDPSRLRVSLYRPHILIADLVRKSLIRLFPSHRHRLLFNLNPNFVYVLAKPRST
jgi:hypothetical protein